MSRFVILHHNVPPGDPMHGRGSHYDWMFDNGNTLWTWATDHLLGTTSQGTVRATRLADHRQVYLEYEGPISGNRGEVSQVESGQFEVIAESPERFEFRVTGQRCGLLTFQRASESDNPDGSEDSWDCTFLPTRKDAS